MHSGTQLLVLYEHMVHNYAFSQENGLDFCLSLTQILLPGPDCMAQVSSCQVLFLFMLWVAWTQGVWWCLSLLLPSCMLGQNCGHLLQGQCCISLGL